jgi:hypothetical protein
MLILSGMNRYVILLAAALVILVPSLASAQLRPPQESALDRFLRYAKVDTQSAEDQKQVPSVGARHRWRWESPERRCRRQRRRSGSRGSKLFAGRPVYKTKQ